MSFPPIPPTIPKPPADAGCPELDFPALLSHPVVLPKPAPPPQKLARTQMRGYAQRLLVQQGGRCPLCQEVIDLRVKGAGVIDHDHKTGRIRGLLCRACNGAEGKVANAAGRWGARSMEYSAILGFLKRLVAYLEREPHPHIYPFHKTPEELRIEELRKRRVRAAAVRAKKRVQEQS